MPTNSEDADDGDDDADRIVMDDAETDAGFLEDRDPDAYPSVLRVTVADESDHRRASLDRLDRWEDGEEVPHVISFEAPSDLRALLTDRRIELLHTLMTERPESIRDLAARVDRDVKTVHDDLQVLAEYDVVHFEADGRAKRPFVPYDTVEVRLEIAAPDDADDAAPA